MKPMSSIVQTCARILVPMTIIFGLYLIIHGHLTPGGGFQGGAIIASVTALLIITFGRDATMKTIKKDVLTKLESGGLLAFISLVFLGIGTSAFYNFLAKSPISQPVAFGPNAGSLLTAGTIPLYSAAVGLEVLAGLSIILLMLAAGSMEVKK